MVSQYDRRALQGSALEEHLNCSILLRKMSGFALQSRCFSLGMTRFCCSVQTFQHFLSSASSSPRMVGCLSSNCARVDDFIPQRYDGLQRRHIVKPAAAAPLHTGGGSVDRNDAASTGPLTSPSSQLSLDEAVRLQMEALACNDEPRPDHGLEVMYYFANTEGTDSGSSLPQYFGFPSDLYHFGHFALKFKTRYPELINHSGYEILGIKEVNNADKGDCADVIVQLRGINGACTWTFTMSKHARGQQLPCWLTTTLTRCSTGLTGK